MPGRLLEPAKGAGLLSGVIAMEDKPTPVSVTAEPCRCNSLQEYADDPKNPIEFDKRTNEFYLRHVGPNNIWVMVFYHCPFCGGAAPKSRRELLFARIPPDEQTRLANLLIPLQSIDEAIRVLGTPDYDGHSVANYPDDNGNLRSIVYHRELGYYKLSDIADVVIHERSDGKVSWQLDGKTIES
jgi:hypothetical protein